MEEAKKDIEDKLRELFDFEIKFGEYLKMKNKNVKTEDILKELEQFKRVSMRKR